MRRSDAQSGIRAQDGAPPQEGAPSMYRRAAARRVWLSAIITVTAVLSVAASAVVLAHEPSAAHDHDDHAHYRGGFVHEPPTAGADASRGLQPGTGRCRGLYETAAAHAHPNGKGCTHGADHYELPASVLAGSEIPDFADLPGVPCYTSGPYVHVFYIYRSGTASKLAQREPLIREAVSYIDWLYNRSAKSHGGVRHIRWLMRNCNLVVTAASVSSSLFGDPTALRLELARRGLLRSSEKALAWIDDGGASGCFGVAEMWPDDRASGSVNLNNNPSNSRPMLGLVAGGCWLLGESRLIATEVGGHELGHTLGAVQNSAPHSSKVGHCWDEDDMMCYADGGTHPLEERCNPDEPPQVDCGRNDYFHPQPKSGSYLATHWNTARNRYLATGAPRRWDRLARPSVRLESPAAGAVVAGQATLKASATVATGSIKTVFFTVNGKVVGSDSTAPYSVKVPTIYEGFSGYRNGTALQLRAHAVDSFYRWAGSPARKATVGNPQVRLTSPTSYTLADGSTGWSAAASAGSGRTIDKVQFFVNGQFVDSDLSAPFSGTWDASTFAAWGSVSVHAIATDSGGVRRSTEHREVLVSDGSGGPTVRLADEFALRTVSGNTRLLALATAPVGATVSNVEFLVGGDVVATDSTAPYMATVDFSSQPEGGVSVTARVTDSRGDSAESGEMTALVVSPLGNTVAVTQPADLATVTDTFTVGASAVPAPGFVVDSVTFYVDGQWIGDDTSAPWQATASAVGFGPHVVTAEASFSNGTTFEFAMAGAEGVVVTRTPPTIAIASPAAGAKLRGTATVTATVSGGPLGSGGSVAFYAGERLIGEDFSSPWSVQWFTAEAHDADVALRAEATVDGVRVATSAPREMHVRNARVSWSAPANGASVSGTVTLQASAKCDNECLVEWVRFYVDGTYVGRDGSAPYTLAWDSSKVSNGSHTLRAEAWTTDGRHEKQTRAVTVSN
jgi:hypothetical protein